MCLSSSSRSFSLVFFSFGTLSFSILPDEPENSRCTLIGRTHICALGIIFAKLGKMGRKDAKLLEMFFFLFYQNIKDGKAEWRIVGDAHFLAYFTCAYINMYILE